MRDRGKLDVDTLNIWSLRKRLGDKLAVLEEMTPAEPSMEALYRGALFVQEALGVDLDMDLRSLDRGYLKREFSILIGQVRISAELEDGLYLIKNACCADINLTYFTAYRAAVLEFCYQ